MSTFIHDLNLYLYSKIKDIIYQKFVVNLYVLMLKIFISFKMHRSKNKSSILFLKIIFVFIKLADIFTLLCRPSKSSGYTFLESFEQRICCEPDKQHKENRCHELSTYNQKVYLFDIPHHTQRLYLHRFHPCTPPFWIPG